MSEQQPRKSDRDDHDQSEIVIEISNGMKLYFFFGMIAVLDALHRGVVEHASIEGRVLAILGLWLSAFLDQSSTIWVLRRAQAQNDEQSVSPLHEEHWRWRGRESELAQMPLFDVWLRAKLGDAVLLGARMEGFPEKRIIFPFWGRMMLVGIFPLLALPTITTYLANAIHNIRLLSADSPHHTS